MASMGDMPDVTWNVMPLCSCHRLPGITAFLPSKNALYAHFRRAVLNYSFQYPILAVARPRYDVTNKGAGQNLSLKKDGDEFSLGIGAIFVPGHCNLLV